jgi:hypothetical protein
MYIIFDHIMRFECVNDSKLNGRFPKVIQPSIMYKIGDFILFNVDTPLEDEDQNIKGKYKVVDITHTINYFFEGEQETTVYLERIYNV